MDLLKKELERKRKAVQQAKSSKQVQLIHTNNDSTSSSTNNTSKKVYLRTADLRRFEEEQREQEREQKEREERERLEEKVVKKQLKRKELELEEEDHAQDTSALEDTTEKASKRSKKRAKLDSKASKKKKKKSKNDSTTESTSSNQVALKEGDDISSSADVHDNDKSNSPIVDMTSEEITKAMRELGIPIWLFGERTDDQRIKRLHEAQENQKAVMAGMNEMEDFRLGIGHGIRNTFLTKKGQEDDEDELLRKRQLEESKTKPGGTAAVASTTTDEDILTQEDDGKDPHKTIHKFFKALLKRWEDELVNRPESVKRTAAGKNETKTLKQCKDYIRPLFKLCKTRRLEENMMGHILKIVQCCKEGEFVKANDSYMDVAIGRAAWPIGVTMVGIHARSGRAKIESSNVAHVMNSELQRKYLTSVKRLMNYCQKVRKDVAPSKKVTNC